MMSNALLAATALAACAAFSSPLEQRTAPLAPSASPVDALVVDLTGDGFHLVPPALGVTLTLRGQAIRVGWTEAGSLNAFLAVDRNGDGRVDVPSELLGKSYVKSDGVLAKSGFDGLLDLFRDHLSEPKSRMDVDAAEFSRLRLWCDANHDGVAEPKEVVDMATAGVTGVVMSYQVLNRPIVDHGNFVTRRGSVLVTKRGVDFPRSMNDIQFGTGGAE